MTDNVHPIRPVAGNATAELVEVIAEELTLLRETAGHIGHVADRVIMRAADREHLAGLGRVVDTLAADLWRAIFGEEMPR